MSKERGDREFDCLERLSEENSLLHKRNAELENEILRLRSASMLRRDRSGDETEKLWWIEGREEILMKSRSYPRYIFSLVKSNSLWLFVLRWLSHFRRFRLLSIVFRWITKIIVLAESGVAFLAWFSFMLIALPVLAVISLASLTVALFRSKNANTFFREELRGKKVYILFSHKKQLEKKRASNFFSENVQDLASDGSVVFVVSPYFFGKKGLGGRSFYVTARKESTNIYLVRKNYFFMLRRRVIDKTAGEVITIY